MSFKNSLQRRSPKKREDIRNIEDILGDFNYLLAGFPEAAIEVAIEKKEEITPILLDILDDALMNYDKLEDAYLAPIYAMYLLAKFREKKAFYKIMDVLQLPEQGAELILGSDGVTEYGIKNIISSTFNGDLQRIYGLIEDRDAFEYSRSAGMSILLALYVTRQVDYKTIIEYFHYLILQGLEKPQPLLWSILASAIMDLYAIELYEPMKQAFEAELVDDDFMRLAHFENHFKEDKDVVRKEWLYDRYHMIDDVCKEMSWWACFKENEKKKKSFDGPATTNRKSRKIGRNDFCPCGSGKKFKKCCLLPGQLNTLL